MDTHGPNEPQHPFDDFDHVRPMQSSPESMSESPLGPDPGQGQGHRQASTPPRPVIVTALVTNSNSINPASSIPLPASPHPLSGESSIRSTNTVHALKTSNSSIHSGSNTTFFNNRNSNGSGSSGNTQNQNHSHHSLHHHTNHHNHNQNRNPNLNTHPTNSSLGPPMPQVQTSTTSLATSAAARLSLAFSPLLSSRRKSQAIDMPSTPDSHKSFLYSLSSSAHASPGSIHTSNDGHHHHNRHSASQEHLANAGSSGPQSSSYHPSNFESNLSKIASFSSPRSSARTRKTLPSGIAHVPEESGYGSFTTPPPTATAFHTGLASHFGTGSSSSQNRDHHDTGYKENTGKGSIVGGSSSIEKALKKAKGFLDEKAKPKARAASLWSFIDGTFEFDQAKFFQDHADQVFAVTRDAFWHQIEKFKQKPDRNNSLQSKEVIAVQKTLLLLRLIFLYLPDRMKNGWHKQSIANMLAQVLCHKNHPRIRIFGFRLLLLWINDHTVEYPEAVYLFSNAISLDHFMYDGEDLALDHASMSQTRLPLMGSGSTGRRSARQVSQYFEMASLNLKQQLLQSDGPPICPNPSPPTFQDSIQLFQIFLANIVRMAYVAAGSSPPPGELESINSHYPLEADGEMGDGIAVGFGIDAGLASARFMFDIVKKYYLVKVFPECARRLNLLQDEGKDFGYKSCPPTILRTVISFVIQYCLDSNEFNSPQTHTSPATPILKSIVYSSEINREIIHEIVRQGLSLPAGHPQYKDIVRGAVHIVGVWCLSGEEERPSFLRSTSNRSQMPTSSSTVSLSTQETGSQQSAPTEIPHTTANSFLQRYFQLLTNVFSENPLAVHDYGSNSSSDALGSTGSHAKLDIDALFQLYRDIIGLFRTFITRGQIEMDIKSWEVLLECLLEIQRRTLALQEKFSSAAHASAADDLATVAIETVLCAYSRCPNVSDAQWIALRKTMMDSLRWPQAVAQWARWALRMTHVIAQDVFRVDLDAPTARPSQAMAARHSRKMSEKIRHSRYLTSKTENSMRHSIGGELLSSQGIPYAHQTFPLSGLNSQERLSRRTNSVHYESTRQSGPGSHSNGSALYAPTLLGHMGFLPSRDLGRDFHSNLRMELGDVEDDDSFDHVGSHISALTEAVETTDEKLSRASSLSFHGPGSLHLDPIVERLSPLYGIFSAPEFVNISMKGRTPENVLAVWKNIVCAIGNPNDIQLPLVKTEVMLCLIDIWDLLHQTRTCQPLNATLIPPLYDFAPWFFEAAKSSSDGGVGLPAIYGGLCRMMSRRYDQDFDPEYYQLFYDSVIQLLKDGHLRDGVNHFIRKQAIAILCSVSMQFYEFQFGATSSDAQQQQEGVDLLTYKRTFTRLVLDLTTAEAHVKPLGKFWDTHSMLIQLCGMLVVNEWRSSLATCDIGTESELLLLVLDHLYWTEVSIVQSAVEVITTLAGMYQDHEDNGWTVLSHLLSAMQEHLKLFQSEHRRGMVIVSLYRCLTEWLMVIPSSSFSETELSRWVFELIEIGLLSAPDATGENERKRALQVAKQQQQQQQQQLQYLTTNRKRGPSFKHTCKSIHQHHRVMVISGAVADIEIEQHLVKESAEATLIHLAHFLNNAPKAYGSGRPLITLGMETGHNSHISRSSDSSNSDESTKQQQSSIKSNGALHENQRIFALNDSILITLEEVPYTGVGFHRTRVTIRDETGRYSWDSEIFYREMLQAEEAAAATTNPRPRSVQRAGSRLSERFGSSGRRRKKEMASQLLWREGVKIREDQVRRPKPRTSSSVSSSGTARDATNTNSSNGNEQSGAQAAGIEIPLWDAPGVKGDADRLDRLLLYIGKQHPDCLFDGKTPLNQLNNGMALSTEPRGGNSQNSSGTSDNNASGNNNSNRRLTIDFELDRHVQEESYYTRISDPQARAWYDKLVELRSSLIQADDEVDDYYGSNTLMSLVVNANWNGGVSSEGGSGNPLLETDPQHKAMYDQAKRSAGRRIRHENLQEIHTEVIAAKDGLDGSETAPGTSENQKMDKEGVSSTEAEAREEQEKSKDILCKPLGKEDAANMAKAFQLAMPPEPERPLDSYQHSRLLLSHLGLLCFDRFQEQNFVLLNHSASLDRDLKSLDKKSGRETFKIAVLYVAAGQEGEQAILRNSKGSAAYNQFVRDLGWEVDLAEHPGYIGGLERNGSNGQTSIYYSTSTLEIMFHEVVRMPTDPDDPQQVKKKRHVGNDHVHIVWSEHSRAYDRNTIGGDFGNAIIVLTPVAELKVKDGQLHINQPHVQPQNNNYSNRLVSVEVIRDMNLPVFGPLVDGMVVPMSQLGRLVRQTAIHAARLATAPPPLPPTPPSGSFAGPSMGTGLGGSSSAMAMGSINPSAGGQQHHRSSVYYPGSMINSAMQGHQYHQSNPAIHTGGNAGMGSTMGGSSSSSSSASGTSAGFGTGGGTAATPISATSRTGCGGIGAGISTVTTASTTTLLGASINSLANTASNPNAASATSLVSNFGGVGNNAAASNAAGLGGNAYSSGGITVAGAGAGAGGSGAASGSMSLATTNSNTGNNSTTTTTTATTSMNLQHIQQALAQAQSQSQQSLPLMGSTTMTSNSIQAPSSAVSVSATTATTSVGGGGIGAGSGPAMGSAINTGSFSTAFSTSMLSVTHNAHPFKQRSLAIEQIAKRHKVEKWTFQQFMEQVFGYSTHLHPHPHHPRNL
ncbi:Ral GTPase-activating protein subunit alpha-2 [Haplosporangium sp. Z 767]|nr:Ral GTPase-activating protein subunit alpha-2 [Haplosporangium sp. Z 767]